ncbi:MAG: MFS transporter [Promethearchaeota archaeon]
MNQQNDQATKFQSDDNTSEDTFKNYYNFIFAFFYLIEGMHQAIPSFASYYILTFSRSYDAAALLFISSITTIPWSIKFLVGLFNDRFGSKKFGKRYPFILGFGIWCAIFWIIEGIFLPAEVPIIYPYLLVFGILTNIGMAFADTTIDGLILDVTPKRKLAKMQAYTWASLLIGMGGGAVGLALLFLYLGIIPMLFVLTGILVAISSAIPKLIKEPDQKGNLNMLDDIKRLIKKFKNWKIYTFTFLDRIPSVLVGALYGNLILIGIGMISLEQTMASLQHGELMELVGVSIIFSFISGAGTIIGSLLIGIITDKQRRWGIYVSYLCLATFIIASNLLHGPGILGWVLGIIGSMLGGFASGGLTTSGQTIRGDYAKREFPNLKSTFYALLVSFSNLGMAAGGIISSFLFITFANLFNSFSTVYLLVSLIAFGIALLSFVAFKSIDPRNYEFQSLIQQPEDFTVKKQ